LAFLIYELNDLVRRAGVGQYVIAGLPEAVFVTLTEGWGPRSPFNTSWLSPTMLAKPRRPLLICSHEYSHIYRRRLQRQSRPRGWAFVAVQGEDALHEKAGSAAMTTNNQMELTAVIEGLRWAIAQGQSKLEIHTDSQYVKNGITSWIHNWIKNGWKTAAKKPREESGILDPPPRAQPESDSGLALGEGPRWP
jgi:hypothetical protein